MRIRLTALYSHHKRLVALRAYLPRRDVEELADKEIQEEVRNAARTLLEAVQARRAGRLVSAGNDLEQPRQK